MTPYTPFTLAIAAALGYAGFKRGQKIERKCPDCAIVLPTIGWSLLGTVGPGYLVGRLSTDSKGGVSGLRGFKSDHTCPEVKRVGRKLQKYCKKMSYAVHQVSADTYHSYKACTSDAEYAVNLASLRRCMDGKLVLLRAKDAAKRGRKLLKAGG